MKNMMGLQEADKPKYSPEVKYLVSVLKDNKVYSAQIQKFINRIDEFSKDGLVDFGLITRGILKTLKLKGNKDINVFEFFKQLTKSLEKRKNKKEVVNPEEEPSILDKDIYKKEIFFLQVELLKLQEWLKQTGKTVIIVFEGRDSAGKGSTIKKFTENLNPRYYKVIALGIPTPDERKNWWDRYSNQIEKGKINFFDRSWYNRGLVEPVMGYGSSEEYEDFMDNVQDFEESLVVDGDYLFKLWFSIDKETQAKRFDFRQKSPLKYWKYSENDEKMQDVWEKFTEYKQKLFDKTSTVNHPWVILDANDKKISGLNSIRYVLQNIPYTNKDEDILNKDFPEAMTVLKPNINEQSWVDTIKSIGNTSQKQEPNFMDKWSSMAPPKDQMTPNSGGVVSDINKTIKSGLETAKKSLDKKSSNSSDSYATRCSTRAIDYIKKQEGFRPEPYKDTNGILTIGYGQIKINGRPVRPGDIITEPEASKKVNDYLEHGSPEVKDSQGKTIQKAVSPIKSQILSLGGGHQKLTQNQFDALCSLMYNYGGYATSNLRKTIQINPNPQKNPEIEKHFTTGWKDGELIKRRKHEYGLYSKGDYTTYNQA
jgi:polyphosphate kinase 2